MKCRMTDSHLRVLEKEQVDCADVAALLGDYTEDDLGRSLKARLDWHMQNCSICNRMRDSYQWVINSANALDDAPVPTEVQNRLRAALNQRLGIKLPMVE